MATKGRISLQVQILVLALWLWALVPRPELWALVGAYVAAWLILQLSSDGTLEVTGRSWLPVLFFAALIAVPISMLGGSLPDFLAAEGWVGGGQHLGDRLRLEADPSIAPPLVSSDRPQSFYVKAQGARELELELGEGGPDLRITRIGEGLFLAAYDPREDGPPAGDRAVLEAILRVDGKKIVRPLNRVDPEAHPRWFCSHPDLGLAAAPSEETDELIVLSRDGSMRRIATGDGPTDCAFFAAPGAERSGEGAVGDIRLAVSHRYDTHLSILDAGDFGEVGRVELGPFQERLAIDPAGRRLAVGLNGLVAKIAVLDLGRTLSASAESAIEEIVLDSPADWLTFGRHATELVVSSATHRTLSRFRRRPPEASSEADGYTRQSWREDGHLWLGRPVVTMTSSLDGERLFIAVTDYRPSGEDHRGNHFIQDQILTLDLEAWRVESQSFTARRTERQKYPGGLDSGTSPMGLAHRPDGTLLIAFAGSEEVWIIDDGFELAPQIFRGPDLGLVTPHGVADLGQGWWAASSPAGGVLAVFDAEGQRYFHGVAPKDDELATSSPGSLPRLALRLRRGERAFYEATRSGISCQSCHLHAGTDSSPHDIGQRPLLPTLTVRGVAATSPYLRDGSFPRVRDLHHGLADSLLRGYRRSFASRPEDLEIYVESLPRPLSPAHWAWIRKREGALIEALKKGWPLFERAACHTCHPPPAFSHLGAHPVRALFPDYGASMSAKVFLDTPSLIGIGAKGHWLQDGRAESLEALLVEHNAANRHGDTADLGAGEIHVLAEFLGSL